MIKPKMKVLIVDDDSGLREAVRLAVTEQDYLDIEVTESPDVASGIKQIEKVSPDLIILDLNMPDKSGFDFIEIMKKNKHLAKPKVIILSANDTLENIFKAGNAGVNEHYFLSKPFNILELQALVLSICLPIKT